MRRGLRLSAYFSAVKKSANVGKYSPMRRGLRHLELGYQKIIAIRSVGKCSPMRRGLRFHPQQFRRYGGYRWREFLLLDRNW